MERRVNGADHAAGLLAWRAWIDPMRRGWQRGLLVFVPAALVAWAFGASPVVQFTLAALAIVPLAGLIGEATEALVHRVGTTAGVLLNATFGNAAELIIALLALFRGLDNVVKASITGSIIGNVLLVLGASLLAGGVRHRVQRFNRAAAGNAATLMVLAAMALLVPAVFHQLVGRGGAAARAEHSLSLAVALILMVAYGLSLVFSLITHPTEVVTKTDHEPRPHGRSFRRATLVLLGSTALVTWLSEILVGAIEGASRQLGLTDLFVGVIVVAVVGNAAEHATAVWMALKNEAELAVGIPFSSAQQIALLVAPVLVLASYARSKPMDLLFTPLEIVAVILAVLIARMVAEDGESNWLEGAMLCLLYIILGMAFYFLPEAKTHEKAGQPPAAGVYRGPVEEGLSGSTVATCRSEQIRNSAGTPSSVSSRPTRRLVRVSQAISG